MASENEDKAKEIEELISQIQGVISGRLVCENDEIVEIHVLADSSRSPKQVVRDIESAVLIKLGIELDHKRISVAQLEPGVVSATSGGVRLLLKSISYKTETGQASVTVVINSGDEQFSATVIGQNNRQNRLRLTASATLSAIEQFLKVENILFVGDVQETTLYGCELVAIAVCMHLDNREEILLGTALNRGDDLESAVRASLDAINRRLSVFIKN
ncbi:MAG TPA: hypothetical protein ENN91_02660 [Firmicutes bacterium]|nr:hypothetical protein [Bacillota bacterium]